MRNLGGISVSERQNDSARDTVRRRLHALDACLEAVEDARERDERWLPDELAERLCELVPGVRPRMPIARAHELVLAQQARVLLWLRPDRIADVHLREERAPLDERAARSLTDRIRTAAAHVSLLLLEAREGHAWRALGYPSWAHYVREEVGLSRSRAYELLVQARVLETIRRALGLSGVPDVSPYAASQVKPRLAEVLSVVERRGAGLPEERVLALVKAAVDEVRGRGSDLVEAVPAG